MRRCDVLVVGAGPAGATAALGLARAGLDVVVAEKERFPRRKVCGEFVSAPTWALLRELGVAEALAPQAGPPVTRVGLFAGEHRIEAAMPAHSGGGHGRAVGRHLLDAALLDAARSAGAEVWQPAAVKQVGRMGEWHRAKLGDGEIAARLVVDTHGSWLAGPFAPLPPTSDRDLLGFKARFAGASLPRGLMPLVLFPGGYGGLVHTDGGDVSFSCCIGYGVLRRAREGFPSAGEAVLAHVSGRNRAFRETLSGATLRGSWLAAGPIRPGFRTLHRDGVFAAGNAAGEAHPLVAEGIAMAIQSGWLLARHLASATPLSAARGYARDWRRHFARRIRAAQLFESLAATAAPAFVGAVRLVPAALTWGAWASGKSHLPAPELA